MVWDGHAEEAQMIATERRGRDRRRDRRYNCSGHVRIWDTESGVSLSGAILNLSMGGCLIQVQSPGRFELHSVIEASFQSSYLAFRSMASVRRIETRSGLLGIAYRNLSLRGRLDLGELFVDLDALIAEERWNSATSAGHLQPRPTGRHRSLTDVGPFLLLP
jgi:PilZ domain